MFGGRQAVEGGGGERYQCGQAVEGVLGQEFGCELLPLHHVHILDLGVLGGGRVVVGWW